MPRVNGGKDPDPDDIERRFQELSRQVERGTGTSGTGGEPGRPGKRRDARAQRRAQRQAPGAGPRRTSLKSWLVAVVVLAIAGGLTYLRLGGTPANPADDSTPVTNGAVPSSSPAAPGAPAGPPADPFTGSPAESYADGAAGIVVPAVHAIRGYPAAEVRAAYATTRELLIATNLDPQTLRGGSPTALASLLIRQQRQFFISNLDKVGLNKQGVETSTRTWVTSFAPHTTRLIGSVIKVHGTMSASVASDGSRQVLRVHVDYLFVYPVEPPGEPADWMRIVNRSYGDVDFATWDDPGGALEPWLGRWNAGGTAGDRCDVNDGFVHPDYPTGNPDKVKPSGAPINPYSQAGTPNFKVCAPTTGT